MPGAAIKLREFRNGPDALVLDGGTAAAPGPDGLAYLLPEPEPISAGAPPVMPELVGRMATGYARRIVACASGQVGAQSAGGGTRPGFTVRWKGLSRAERDLVRAWLRDTVKGTLNSYDVEVDGPGLGGAGVVKVRGVAEAQESWEGRPSYTITQDVEEVF